MIIRDRPARRIRAPPGALARADRGARSRQPAASRNGRLVARRRRRDSAVAGVRPRVDLAGVADRRVAGVRRAGGRPRASAAALRARASAPSASTCADSIALERRVGGHRPRRRDVSRGPSLRARPRSVRPRRRSSSCSTRRGPRSARRRSPTGCARRPPLAGGARPARSRRRAAADARFPRGRRGAGRRNRRSAAPGCSRRGRRRRRPGFRPALRVVLAAFGAGDGRARPSRRTSRVVGSVCCSIWVIVADRRCRRSGAGRSTTCCTRSTRPSTISRCSPACSRASSRSASRRRG